MKKLLSILILAVLLLTLSKCRKGSSVGPKTIDALIREAKQYFNDSVASNNYAILGNPRISSPKEPIWDSAHIITTTAGEGIVVPVTYKKSLHIRSTISGTKLFGLNELTHLLLYRDNLHRFHAELITGFPDSLAIQSGSARFSGILFVEDWAGNRLRQYQYSSDGHILQKGLDEGSTHKSSGITTNSSKPVQSTVALTTCYEITGYNYSPDDPDDGYAWSEPGGCESSYYPVTQSLAPVGSPSPGNYGTIPGAGNGVLTVNIPPPDNPIDNIQAYFRCFTNSSSIDHTYSVTVCVSQPVPGSRSPWAFTSGGPVGSSAAGNPINTGHTFIIFSENSAGSIITRNVGFYPLGIVNPSYPSDQGILDDNEKTSYNISMTYNVTNAQFFNMLNYASLGNNPGYIYNLNTNNCTTFAIHTLAAGDITLSSSQGVWPGGGHGYDPGDIGEDIRNMPLPSNASRNTVSNSHPNQGSCN